jgi:hypothetical protein
MSTTETIWTLLHRLLLDHSARIAEAEDKPTYDERAAIINGVSAHIAGKLEAHVDARLSELERENAALREALKPFASEGALWHDSTTTPTEDEPLWISSYETRRSPDEAKFTLGDLRRARAALAGSGEK